MELAFGKDVELIQVYTKGYDLYLQVLLIFIFFLEKCLTFVIIVKNVSKNAIDTPSSLIWEAT